MWPFRRKGKSSPTIVDQQMARIDQEITRRAAPPPIQFCVKCNVRTSEPPITWQSRDGQVHRQVICYPCSQQRTTSRGRPDASKVLREIMSDLDHLEKGDVTEEELEYVRRSVLGGEG